MQADAASEAAGMQSASADRSVAEQRRQYDLTRKDQSQYLGTGQAANKRLAALLGIAPAAGIGGRNPDEIRAQIASLQQQKAANTDAAGNADPVFDRLIAEASAELSAPTQAAAADPSAGSLLRPFGAADLQADPVYQSGLQFGLDRGTEGINSRAAAGGMYDSGQTLKALTGWASDYGSQKAGESRNRYVSDQDSIYNKLAGVSGSGQVATAQVGAAGANAANNISQDLTGAGNARAAGIVGGANAWSGALGGVSGAAQGYANNQRFDALMAQQGGYQGGGYQQPYYTGYSNGEYAYG